MKVSSKGRLALRPSGRRARNCFPGARLPPGVLTERPVAVCVRLASAARTTAGALGCPLTASPRVRRFGYGWWRRMFLRVGTVARPLPANQSIVNNFDIHMVNLRGIDLNLLTVFEAVYEERSQSRAADRLGLTQPAVSNALRRLRHRVGDPLFHGRAKGLATTAKADDLYRGIHRALDAIRTELGAARPFDPAASRRTFVIAIGFGGGALLGLRIFRAAARDRAPHPSCPSNDRPAPGNPAAATGAAAGPGGALRPPGRPAPGTVRVL